MAIRCKWTVARPPQALRSDTTFRRTDLVPGDHTVLLAGLAANCTAEGPNPRTITISAGETTAVALQVTCVATTGGLQVSASSSGTPPDPDGYRVTLDGADRGPLANGAELVIDSLAPGYHQVGLGGVAANCRVEGENSRTVSVTAGQRTPVAFAVTCAATPPDTGSIQVSTSTTGPNQDADGYSVALDGAAAQPIGVEATLTLGGLAAGSHTVALSGVAPNCQIQGENPRAVAVTAGSTAAAGFSIDCPNPANGKIAFVSVAPGILGTFVVNPDGTGLASLGDGVGPVWSPDRRRIATLAGGGITVMNADGSGRTKITSGSVAVGPRKVHWSPDGSLIAFEGDSTRLPECCPENIWVVRTDGGGQRQVIANGTVPSWSPDGRRIAFQSSRNGDNEDIYVANADGSGVRRLTTAPEREIEPAWSPDGTQIAFFLSDTPNLRYDTFLINPDGTGLVNLTRGGARGVPVWSPDASRIAFSSDNQIIVINRDGSGGNAITHGEGVQGEGMFAWSPDGSQIAFSRFDNPDVELYVVSATGGEPTNVSNRPDSYEVEPDWASR